MFTERFQVVLEADDYLRQRIETGRLHELDDIVAAQVGQQAIHDRNRARLIHQLERTARLLHQGDAQIDVFAFARVLAFLDIVQRRRHHRAENVVHLVVAGNIGLAPGRFHRRALLHLVERLFDLQQFRRHG